MRNPLLCPILCALALGPLSAACGGRKNVHIAPEPQVDMDPRVLAKFANEVRDYVELRHRLAGQIPSPAPQSTPDQIAEHQRVMKLAIQRARKGAKRGDMFKKSVEAAIRRVIQKEMSGPERGPMVKEIKQGNPKVEGVPKRSDPTVEVKKSVPLRINGDYPDDAPFSSVPPTLLLKLPQLPEEVRYRFVGPHLLLRDTEANVILDYILNAIPDGSLPR